MNLISFSKKVEDTIFMFEKIILENRDVMYFVSSDLPNERSFFMAKKNSGNWEILYRAIVSPKILSMERELSGIIEESNAQE